MNFLKLTLLALIIIFNCFGAMAQTDITVGKNHTIPSKILNQERVIQVYLPQGYDTSEMKYPVLFILDGQRYFSIGVAIQQSQHFSSRMPKMIIVGIKTQNPLRRTLYGNKSETFIDFLADEVIPFVNNNFRTSNDRILFGWESAAFFSSQALFHKKQLFNAAIITNGAYASEKTIEEFSNLNLLNNKYLFVANSMRDIYTIKYSNTFVELLKEKSPNNLTWKYELFEDEIHESLPFLALYHGLKNYYHNYGSLVFGSVSDYEKMGGMPYLKKYFKQRGERFGFDTSIDNSTKDALIWLAWNHNDFKSFHFFMTEFKDVLSTKRYDSAYWQNRFAQFYLKHDDVENAILYFKNGITNYPKAGRLALMYSGLAKAYIKKNDKKLAIQNLEQAVKIAEQNSDDELENYKKQLLELKK